MHKQTKIFSKRVVDFMHTPKVCVEAGTFCEHAISRMVETGAKACVVVDGHGKLAGILRQTDILSKVVFKVAPQTLIDAVMDDRVQTMRADEYLYHAIGRMRRYGVGELVVVDLAMKPVGMVYLQDAVEIAATDLMQQIDRLSGEGDVESLRGVKAAQVDLAHDMFEDHQPASVVQHLLTHINKDIYSRIIHDNICHLEAEGWGRPPVEFCAIVMGSAGRGENYLYPDQDNGFILQDYPDEDHNKVDEYFRELASRMCRDLDEVGFPLCTGNVMATNPVWRKSLTQWCQQVGLWAKKRNSTALRLADIFFDFQPVYGQTSLADELRYTLVDVVKKNHFFLQEMYCLQADHTVGINMFGRLVLEEAGDQAGLFDVKYRATLPLVEAVRLFSLKNGIASTGTLDRVERLHRARKVSDTEQEYLTFAFNFLTKVLLKRQIEAFKSNAPVTRFIDPKTLSKQEKETLLRALRHVDAFRKRLKAEFTGDVF